MQEDSIFMRRSAHCTTRRGRHGESGQAIVELTIMLVALVAIILGVIFTAGLAITDNKVLLEAKRNAERAARFFQTEPQPGAWEYSRWEYGSYSFSATSKASIPFSALDRQVRTDINSIQNASWEFRTPIYSEATRYHYEWMAPGNFDSDAFRADATAAFGNALNAATLVGATSTSNQPAAGFETGYADGAAAAMRNAMFTWFGVKIDADTVRLNPTNTVYMPTGEISR